MAGIVHADLVGQGEDEARKRLLAQASGKRGKPSVAPTFPGLMQQVMPQPPVFPGPAQPAAQQTLWMVPHRRNPYFTGRDETLEQLHATFTAKPGIVTQALTELGGIGKTQTVLEYAFRFAQKYQAVFWAQAETRELLIGDLSKMAALLQLPERDAQEQEVIVASVTCWLEVHSGWLLVLDNVEDVALAREALPRQGSGHVLLTMRAAAPSGFPQRGTLEPMPLDEAAQFLLRRASLLAPDVALALAPTEQQTQARAIAQELGSLTLALDQAGAYIEETGCSLKDYLALLQTQRATLLRQRGAGVADHPESVAVTWNLAFKKVKQASPAAADLLCLCAFLSPEAIPEDLFQEGADELPAAFCKAAAEPHHWNTTLAALRRFSLIERQAETRTLALHRLVQAVLRDALPAADRRRWAERAVRLVNAAFPGGNFDYSAWERCQQFLPHALVSADLIEQWHLAFSEAAHLLNQASIYLYRRAQYAEAIRLFQRALAIQEQRLGPTHPDVATSLNNLAALYHNQRQDAEALPLMQRALAIDEQAYGPDHPEVATDLSNLAALLRQMGQNGWADELLTSA